MNLLIVDDEILTVKGIQKGIHWDLLPFENVYTATSVAGAKAVFQKEKIDILLCDIEMPVENGLELLAWIRKENLAAECIFLTCHTEFRYAQEALKLKGMDYLLKPVPYEELQEILLQAANKIEEKNEKEFYQEYGRLQVGKMQEELEEQGENRNKIIIDNTKRYIQEHLQDELSSELLAGMAYVSTTHLHRIFRKEEGMTLVEYITKTRMYYAKQMLKDRKIPITSIAAASGYSNYNYFTKVFKKEFGMTPRECQRKYAEKTESEGQE